LVVPTPNLLLVEGAIYELPYDESLTLDTGVASPVYNSKKPSADV